VLPMSYLLVVAVVLLVAVVGLSLWQRRGTRDMTFHAAPSGPDAPTLTAAKPAAASEPASNRVRADPLVGKLMFDGEGSWHATEAIDFGMGFIDVEFIAGAEGPGAEHTDWMRQAAARWDSLRETIEATLAERFGSSGVTREALCPYWVIVGPRAGRFEGRIEYVLAPGVDGISLLSVRSTDMWNTLQPEIETSDRHGAKPLA
jgi:hypothetical protein